MAQTGKRVSHITDTQFFYPSGVDKQQFCDEFSRKKLYNTLYFSVMMSGVGMDTGKLWTAPEILRENNPPRRGTQRADVYSYAIICYEIMMRTEPYNFDNITPRGRV